MGGCRSARRPSGYRLQLSFRSIRLHHSRDVRWFSVGGHYLARLVTARSADVALRRVSSREPPQQAAAVFHEADGPAWSPAADSSLVAHGKPLSARRACPLQCSAPAQPT